MLKVLLLGRVQLRSAEASVVPAAAEAFGAPVNLVAGVVVPRVLALLRVPADKDGLGVCADRLKRPFDTERFSGRKTRLAGPHTGSSRSAKTTAPSRRTASGLAHRAVVWGLLVWLDGAEVQAAAAVPTSYEE